MNGFQTPHDSYICTRQGSYKNDKRLSLVALCDKNMVKAYKKKSKTVGSNKPHALTIELLDATILYIPTKMFIDLKQWKQFFITYVCIMYVNIPCPHLKFEFSKNTVG